MSKQTNRRPAQPGAQPRSGLTRRQFLKATAGTAGLILGSGLAAKFKTIQFAPEGWAAEADVLYKGGRFDAKGATLRLGDWGGFWEEMQRKNLISQFEKDFNCKIAYDPSWPWFPKYVASGSKNPAYDVSNWNLPEMFKTHKAGDFFLPVDQLKANVPHSKDLWPFATANGVGITYLFSQYGYAYRTDLVKPAPTKFADFWEARFSGKRATYITSNTLFMVFFMVASAVFGKDEKDVEAGFKAMERAMPMKVSDFTGNMQTLMERGEVILGVQHDGEPYSQMDKGLPIGWMYWTERKPILTQTKTVSKYSQRTQKMLAFALIDRSCTPDYQTANGEQLYVRPTNKTAKVPKRLADRGVKNTAEATRDLWIPPWDWYLTQETRVVERVNRILGKR